jgi:hypothetical protein
MYLVLTLSSTYSRVLLFQPFLHCFGTTICKLFLNCFLNCFGTVVQALAAKKEMTRLCEAISEGGGGIFEMSADFSCYDDIPYHKVHLLRTL